VRVRYARGDDSDRLREIRLASLLTDPEAFGGTHAHESTFEPDRWTSWAANSELGVSQRTFVVEDDDGAWLGLALVRLEDESPGFAVLNAMWIAPAARGRGGVGMLCDACATWAAEHGCRELTLTVMVGNQAAQRAYEAAGFVVTGRTTWRRGSEHGGEETFEQLIMVRALAAA
jgi:RimJ/RimL family protein N-acetyltransferase